MQMTTTQMTTPNLNGFEVLVKLLAGGAGEDQPHAQPLLDVARPPHIVFLAHLQRYHDDPTEFHSMTTPSIIPCSPPHVHLSLLTSHPLLLTPSPLPTTFSSPHPFPPRLAGRVDHASYYLGGRIVEEGGLTSPTYTVEQDEAAVEAREDSFIDVAGWVGKVATAPNHISFCFCILYFFLRPCCCPSLSLCCGSSC